MGRNWTALRCDGDISAAAVLSSTFDPSFARGAHGRLAGTELADADNRKIVDEGES
jgi:hypothetical protein